MASTRLITFQERMGDCFLTDKGKVCRIFLDSPFARSALPLGGGCPDMAKARGMLVCYDRVLKARSRAFVAIVVAMLIMMILASVPVAPGQGDAGMASWAGPWSNPWSQWLVLMAITIGVFSLGGVLLCGRNEVW